MKTRERRRLLGRALAAADGPHLAKWLVGNGIRLGCDLVAGGIGKARVAVDGNGFEFDGAGQWMMIMGVYLSPWPASAAEFAVLDTPTPIDVLAFRPGEPGRWSAWTEFSVE